MFKQYNPKMAFELIQQFRKYRVKCNTSFEPDNLLYIMKRFSGISGKGRNSCIWCRFYVRYDNNV